MTYLRFHKSDIKIKFFFLMPRYILIFDFYYALKRSRRPVFPSSWKNKWIILDSKYVANYISEEKKEKCSQQSSLRDDALFTKFIVPPFFYILQNNLLMKSFDNDFKLPW